MKIFRQPSSQVKKAIIFDMDSTLYTHDEYAQSQIELPVKRLAELQGKTFEQMNSEISQYRKKWAETHDGKTISLGNVFISFGISIKESIKWREELCQPEKYLAVDKQLRSVLERLSSCFSLAVVTNNPVSVAVKTLSVLGVYDLLQNIAGLDTYGISKPNKMIFDTVLKSCRVSPEQCISVGDRYDIDIGPALELGMDGILVDGVEDVYKLPDLLTVNQHEP